MGYPCSWSVAIGLVLAMHAGGAIAQTPANAFEAQLPALCAGAAPGSQLSLRCADIFSVPGTTGARLAAAGQRLAEIPGQARVATRDSDPGQAVLQGIAGGWSLHLSADLGRIRRRAGANEAAFDADTGSLTFGADRQLGASWQVGAALHHIREDLDFRESGGEASTRFTGGFLNASRSLGQAWSLSGYVGRLQGGYRLTREISYTLPLAAGPLQVSAIASADPDARRTVGGLAAGGQWNHKGWDAGATAGVDVGSTRIDPYSENGGGGFAVSVPGREVETRRSRIDVVLGRTISTAYGVLQPSLQIGWRREHANPRRNVTVRVLQDLLQTPVIFATEDPDRAWGEVALGGVVTLTRGHSGFIQWRQRFGHSFLDERMLALGWRVELP